MGEKSVISNYEQQKMSNVFDQWLYNKEALPGLYSASSKEFEYSKEVTGMIELKLEYLLNLSVGNSK